MTQRNNHLQTRFQAKPDHTATLVKLWPLAAALVLVLVLITVQPAGMGFA